MFIDYKKEIELLKRETEGVLKEVTIDTEKAVRYSTNIRFRNGSYADIWLPKAVFEDGELTFGGLRLLYVKIKDLEDQYGAKVVKE